MDDKTNVSFNVEQQIDIQSLAEELKELKELKYALDKSSIVAITDAQGRITYVNELFCEIAQYSREELIGKTHRVINSGFHSKEFFKQMWSEIGKGNIWRGEIKNKKKDGSYYWVHATIVPFLNEKGKPYKYLSIRTDITKEKELEEELERSYKKYELIAEHSDNFVALVDADGAFHYVSLTFQILLHYDLKSLEKQNVFNLIHLEDSELLKKEIQKLLNMSKEKSSRKLEFRLLHGDGGYIDVEATIKIIHNDENPLNNLVLIVMSDISVRKEVEQNLYHLAYHDSLTNFPNRPTFMNELRSYVMDVRLTNKKFSILFIDLDNFKLINEQLGHDNGDLVIVKAAENIRESIREIDLVARMGGDEFIVLLRDIKDEQDTINIVNNIIEKFQKPIVVNGKDNVLTCSIGVASYPEHGTTPEELIKNADSALTQVKQKSKNNYAVYNKKLENISLERRIIENAMRKGLNEHQFFLEYQPKFNIHNDEIVGMEALVRWNHPDLGTIPPGKFISLAEETGLIIPLGEWILNESCKQAKEWREKGFGELIVSVNVSVRQLQDPKFVQQVERVLKETGFNPKFLELEVTESIFADLNCITPILKRLRSLGIHISVDDFGTGYSSLSYIKHLPIDTLKVDASFVKDIHKNEESKAIVRAIINLAETIGLKVIAEGIEIEEQVRALRNDGCIFGQGYFYSRPLRKEAFEEYIRSKGFITS
ncbi:EAL domain-containing protein [Ureibacillus sp. FSL W8-0352]|uniref:EAL domain-containing protein n=1 Tax=Ureibacillus sp. FSL W8-0352 TaxID=2954596 RepID=UPI0030FA9262